MESMHSDDSLSDSAASNSSDSSEDSENFTTEWNKKTSQDDRSYSETRSNIILPSSKCSRASEMQSSRSPSKSESDSTSTSFSGKDERDQNSQQYSNSQINNKNSSMHDSFEEISRDGEEKTSISHIQSISTPCSSRSSSSTNQSRLSDNKRVLNEANEDLSDVSDMDSEKRISMESLNDSNVNVKTSSIKNESKEKENQKPLADDDNCRKFIYDNNSPAKEDSDFIPSTDDRSQNVIITDLRQKLDQKKNKLKVINADFCEKNETTDGSQFNGSIAESLDGLVKAHDEDALDFEAEEGECLEISNDEKVENENKENESNKLTNEVADETELEEGEVSDEDDKRGEEIEPRPVCRFYTRGQCTWGTSCRFLHPGVTDKGNYTMFDLVRPIPVPQNTTGGGRPQNFGSASHENFHDYRTDRPTINHRNAIHHQISLVYSQPHHDPRSSLPSSVVQDSPVVVESAWERGLRTAKEMMRKANKRKEQDMDFEDKKMNLTLSPEELEKDAFYKKDRSSPPDTALSYNRHSIYQESSGVYTPPERFLRGPPLPYEELDPYGRSTRYRELPPHRMPQYEDDRRVRPAREVIVQRVEPVGRGDEWNDPWMRSKSPGGRTLSDKDRSDKRRRDCRSFSSHSSYSSTSSSQSDSSSVSSHSLSPLEKRRRYNNSTHKSPDIRRNLRNALRSPSLRRRRSPSLKRRSPLLKRRIQLSPSPNEDKRNKQNHSPISKRKKMSPVKKLPIDKNKSRHRHRSSSSASGSSGSSETDSDSSATSSSGTSSPSRDKTPAKRIRVTEKISNDRKVFKKETTKKRSPICIEIKKPTIVGTSALTSPTTSVSSEKDTKKTRREELLKQLRAVEDAIAKKRSKLV